MLTTTSEALHIKRGKVMSISRPTVTCLSTQTTEFLLGRPKISRPIFDQCLQCHRLKGSPGRSPRQRSGCVTSRGVEVSLPDCSHSQCRMDLPDQGPNTQLRSR